LLVIRLGACPKWLQEPQYGQKKIIKAFKQSFEMSLAVPPYHQLIISKRTRLAPPTKRTFVAAHQGVMDISAATLQSRTPALNKLRYGGGSNPQY